MRVLMLVFALFVGLAAPARAADDVSTGQGVIRAQEQALGRDDAETAYSFASPSIQSVFADADAFVSMVRKSYPSIFRHKSFDFGEAKVEDGKMAQIVHIVDAEGVPWDALYTLERQPDGSLKITGCVLSKLTGA